MADDGFYCWGLLGIPAPSPSPLQDFSLHLQTQAESSWSRAWRGEVGGPGGQFSNAWALDE